MWSHLFVLDDVERSVLANHADGAISSVQRLGASWQALTQCLQAVLDELIERGIRKCIDVSFNVCAGAL